ncbi:MAG: DUF1818 family protein [Elainellaceae cyanobacterium]
MVRHLKNGPGWRLGWHPGQEFCGLVGGDDWALELTEAELDSFCQLIVQLADTLNQISQELMDEERICCEVESEWLWLEAEGYPHHYSLHLMLLTGRRGEGSWSATAIPGLIQAAQSLKVF